MLDSRQVQRKRHVEIFPGGIGHKMLAFPEKIVMMGDGGHSGFGNDLGKRNAQGQVQRDRQSVFRDE